MPTTIYSGWFRLKLDHPDKLGDDRVNNEQLQSKHLSAKLDLLIYLDYLHIQ